MTGQECPVCYERIGSLTDTEVSATNPLNEHEWEIGIDGRCPECGCKLRLYSTTPGADIVHEPVYEVQYEGGILVSVSEAEARRAYNDHQMDRDWASFDKNGHDAAEMAARKKVMEEIEKTGDDIDFEVGVCRGVWRVNPHVVEAVGDSCTKDAHRKATKAYETAETREEMVAELRRRNFARDEAQEIAGDLFSDAGESA